MECGALELLTRVLRNSHSTPAGASSARLVPTARRARDARSTRGADSTCRGRAYAGDTPGHREGRVRFDGRHCRRSFCILLRQRSRRGDFCRLSRSRHSVDSAEGKQDTGASRISKACYCCCRRQPNHREHRKCHSASESDSKARPAAAHDKLPSRGCCTRGQRAQAAFRRMSHTCWARRAHGRLLPGAGDCCYERSCTGYSGRSQSRPARGPVRPPARRGRPVGRRVCGAAVV